MQNMIGTWRNFASKTEVFRKSAIFSILLPVRAWLRDDVDGGIAIFVYCISGIYSNAKLRLKTNVT